MADKKVEGSTPSTDFALDTQIKSWATNAVLGLAIVFAGWAVYSFIRGQQEKTVGEEWRTFTRFEASIQDRNATPISMEMVSEAVRPWAMLEDANRDFTQGKVDRSALVETESRFASLAKNPAAGVAASGMVNVGIGAPAVASSIGQLAEWEKANPQLLDNPNPDASPRVKLVTDAGTIEIALYKAMAPKHVENFVKLAQEGLYTGTKFHRVSKDLQHVIEGGDPNTKEENVEDWGKAPMAMAFRSRRIASLMCAERSGWCDRLWPSGRRRVPGASSTSSRQIPTQGMAPSQCLAKWSRDSTSSRRSPPWSSPRNGTSEEPADHHARRGYAVTGAGVGSP